MFVPHDWPARTGVVAWQTAIPLVQLVTPLTQVPAGGVHAMLATQSTHAPARHTLLLPHAAPSARFIVVALHAGAPVEHARAPTLHGALAGMQSPPFWQATHAPAIEHTPVGHVIPGGFKPERWHTGAPVEQPMVNTTHGSAPDAGAHVAPALQIGVPPSPFDFSVTIAVLQVFASTMVAVSAATVVPADVAVTTTIDVVPT
jgi:hypothetical protein